MTAPDDVGRRFLVAQDEIRAQDVRWWEFWAPKPLTLRALRALFASVSDLKTNYERLDTLMADTSVLLNQVADGLRNLGPHLSTLLAERNALAAENAALKGEDAAESAAADSVKQAFDGVAGLFDQTDEAPTPEPLPDAPASDQPADAPADAPVDDTPPDPAA